MKNKLCTLLAALALLLLPASALAAPYLYVSHKYNFSIECPQKPLGVIPLLDENHPGEMLVFKNDGYTILRAWIISTNAFSDKDMPDFNKLTPEQERDYASILAANRGYQQVRFVSLHGEKIIYAVTPKIVYVSTEKNGKKQEIAKNVAQRIEAYVPGKRTNYAIVFMNTGDPDAAQIDAYQEGLLSFKELNLPQVKKAAAQKGTVKEAAVKASAKKAAAASKKAPAPEKKQAAAAPQKAKAEQPAAVPEKAPVPEKKQAAATEKAPAPIKEPAAVEQVKTELGNTAAQPKAEDASETVEPSAVMK